VKNWEFFRCGQKRDPLEHYQAIQDALSIEPDVGYIGRHDLAPVDHAAVVRQGGALGVQEGLERHQGVWIVYFQNFHHRFMPREVLSSS